MRNENETADILGWDSPIENEGTNFVVLEENTVCDCTVIGFEPKQTKSGAPMAALRIECVAPEGRTIVDDNLALQRNCEWKLCEFFTAIGQRVHGQRIVPDWDGVLGAKCRATVSKEPWLSNPNRFSNKIKKYLEPEQTTPASGEEVSFG